MSESNQRIIGKLNLAPHPEGGYYREHFRSTQTVEWNGKTLSASTAIYFLLQAGDKSWCHRIPQDETWHFYEGGALELICFNETDLTLNRIMLSAENRAYTVPGGWWQAARPLGDYALIGCTVAPGFEFSLFELLSAYPEKRNRFHTAMEGFSSFD